MNPQACYLASTLLVTLLASVPVTAQTGGSLPSAGGEAGVEVRPTLKVEPAPTNETMTVGSRKPVWKGDLISLSLKDADLREVLRSFAKLGRFNLVLDPGVQGKVTVELHDVPWDQALSVILKTHGLAAEDAGGCLLFPKP
jgi:type II secretory pathway component HofQ